MIVDIKNFPILTETDKKYTKIAELTNYFCFKNGLFRGKHTSSSMLFTKKLKRKPNGYLYEIILFGLNYHAKRIKYFKKQFYVDLQKSHRILIDQTLKTPFKTRIFKRRLVLFGFDKRALLNVINLIKKRKPQNSYFGHGAIVNYDKFKLKPGKVRQK